MNAPSYDTAYGEKRVKNRICNVYQGDILCSPSTEITDRAEHADRTRDYSDCLLMGGLGPVRERDFGERLTHQKTTPPSKQIWTIGELYRKERTCRVAKRSVNMLTCEADSSLSFH